MLSQPQGGAQYTGSKLSGANPVGAAQGQRTGRQMGQGGLKSSAFVAGFDGHFEQAG